MPWAVRDRPPPLIRASQHFLYALIEITNDQRAVLRNTGFGTRIAYHHISLGSSIQEVSDLDNYCCCTLLPVPDPTDIAVPLVARWDPQQVGVRENTHTDPAEHSSQQQQHNISHARYAGMEKAQRPADGVALKEAQYCTTVASNCGAMPSRLRSVDFCLVLLLHGRGLSDH